MAVNQGFVAMKPKPGYSNLFMVHCVDFSKGAIINQANGTTFLEISKTDFRPIPVVAPTPNAMSTFDRQVKPLYGRIVRNERESRTLAALRDILLPRLVSGEVGARDSYSETLG